MEYYVTLTILKYRDKPIIHEEEIFYTRRNFKYIQMLFPKWSPFTTSPYLLDSISYALLLPILKKHQTNVPHSSSRYLQIRRSNNRPPINKYQ